MATRTRPPKAETPPDDPPAEPEPAPVAPGDGDPGEPDAEDDRLVAVVEDVVHRVLDGMATPAPANGPTPGTQRADEENMADRVRSALSEIRTDEEREGRLKKLEEKVLVEAPPVKQRLSTKLMGW